MKRTAVSSEGRTFVLVYFDLTRGPFVLEESDSVAEVFKAAPDHLADGRLSVCRVGGWTVGADPTDAEPHDLVTIAEIEPYALDAINEDDEPREEV